MGYIFQLSLAEEIFPSLRLYPWIIRIVGVGPNNGLAVEPVVGEEAVTTQIRSVVHTLSAQYTAHQE